MLRRDVVPDEATALAVGTALIRGWFGDAVFGRWAPYRVFRDGGEWVVLGTNAEMDAQVEEYERSHPGSMMSIRGGGMPGVSLLARDAQVTSISIQR